MPKKQQQRNGFYFFMKELQEDFIKQGRVLPMSEMPPLAHPRWKSLPPDEQKRYDTMAKQWKRQKNDSLDGKMDSRGNLLSEIRRENLEKEQIQAEMRRNIEVTLSIELGSTPAIAAKKFHIVAFNIFCETEDEHFVPAEVGMVEFSLERGVTKVLHKFIHPDQIPLGYASDCRKTSEDTHKIPVDDFDLADRNYIGMYIAIKNFINPNDVHDEYPPVYCLPQDIRKNNYLFNWIFERAAARPYHLVLKAFDLSYLASSMYKFAVEQDPIDPITGRRKAVYSSDYAMEILSSSVFDYAANMSCEWHYENDESRACALTQAKKLAYLMMDNFCQLYGIEVVPGKHIPEDNLGDPITIITPEIKNVRPAKDVFTRPRPLEDRPTATIVDNYRSKYLEETDYNKVVIPSAMNVEGATASASADHAWANRASSHVAPSFNILNEDFPSLGGPLSGASSFSYASAASSKPSVAAAPVDVEDKRRAPLRLPRTAPMVIRLDPNTQTVPKPTPGQGVGRGIGRGQILRN